MEKTNKLQSGGFGLAPFSLAGADYMPGCLGTCDYCGRGISRVFHVISKDGKQFNMGSECVKLVDEKLHYVVDAIIKKAKYDAEEKRISEAKKHLESVAVKLENKKSPISWRNDTLLDYVGFLLQNGGHSGQLKAARFIEKEI